MRVFLWFGKSLFIVKKKGGGEYSSNCSALAAAWAKNILLMFWNKSILCSIVLPFPHRNSFSESVHRKALLMIYNNLKCGHQSTPGHAINASFLKDQRHPPSLLVTLTSYFSVQALINSPWYKNKHTICPNWVNNTICYAALICFWGFVFEVHALEEFGRLFLSTLGCLQASPTEREDNHLN